MPRAIESTFFEPLIHGLDVMLAKAERVIARDRAKPDADAIRHHRDLVNLPRVAEQVAAQCEEDADARSIHLFVDVAPDALVVGDSCELHRVVEQLLASALANTPNGGCVMISGAISRGVVTLVFSSHSPAARSEIHSRFQRGFGAIRSSFFRSDVGYILRAHGGRLEVSDQGKKAFALRACPNAREITEK